MAHNPSTQDKAQWHYGNIVHGITIASCLVALVSPVLILLFPQKNLLSPNLIFSAIFEGRRPYDIWETAGVSFEQLGFWQLIWNNLLRPDGIAMLAIALGTSVTMWALISTVWIYARGKNWFYTSVCVFIILLILFAMSGLL